MNQIAYFNTTGFATISQNTGSVEGGTEIEINLIAFSEAPTFVSFGGMPATIVTATTGKVIIITPKHNKGIVDVVISNYKQNKTFNHAFSYK